MKVTVIFIIVAPGLSFPHRHSDSASSEMDDSRQSQEYESSPYSYRADNKRKQKTRYEVQPGSAEMESSNKKYISHSSKHSRRRSKKHSTRDENCDSNECDQPEPSHAEQPGLSPGNVVFVPYPYPLVVPPPVIPGPTTSATTCTTSTAPSINHDTRALNNLRNAEIDKENYLDLLRTLRHRQELPYVRNDVRPVRRYLLDKLLSRVRNVKDINSV